MPDPDGERELTVSTDPYWRRPCRPERGCDIANASQKFRITRATGMRARLADASIDGNAVAVN